MSMSAWQRVRSKVLVAALVFGAPLAIMAQGPAAQQSAINFTSVSTDLQAMGDLFGGGGGKPVTFDAAAAAQRGLSKESIELAAELAAFTNALMAGTGAATAAAPSVDVTQVNVDLQQFPRVAEFFDEATNHSNQLPVDPKDDEQPQVPEGVQPASFLSEYYCGAFWRPRPSTGAPWKRWYSPSGNAAGSLSAWGYHTTPDWAGGGWTRPQTYTPWLCGWGTFRDHAYIIDRWNFREQYYGGWTPPGEPNPEVWRVGPWPYLTWPAYVRWWHSRY